MVTIVRQPQTFYRRTASKNVVQWTIWLQEDQGVYTIKTSHGQKGGKIIEDAGVVIVSGKSGRTPMEQAVLEFDSKISKHRDQGYTFNTDGINLTVFVALLRGNQMVASAYFLEKEKSFNS